MLLKELSCMTQFSELNLIEPLQRAIDAQGFTTPTAIQSKTIPALMEGRDVIGLSQTGGGKTAAFVLPLLQRLYERKERYVANHPQALILAPTREIAMQIGHVLRDLSKFLPIRYTTVTGGAPMFPQFRDLNRGVNILVATPGRLIDHVKRGSVKFDHTTTLILDEADRMLDLGFSDEVIEIANSLPKEHQTVLFSATMPKSVDRLIKQLLTNPVRIETAKESQGKAQKILYIIGAFQLFNAFRAYSNFLDSSSIIFYIILGSLLILFGFLSSKKPLLFISLAFVIMLAYYTFLYSINPEYLFQGILWKIVTLGFLGYGVFGAMEEQDIKKKNKFLNKN